MKASDSPCPICGAPLAEGYKLCEKHREMWKTSPENRRSRPSDLMDFVTRVRDEGDDAAKATSTPETVNGAR